jgi:O-antigen/teichoic acid export membrane protein
MSVQKNVISNYIGRAILTILSIVFIPIYIKYLGIEAYGLIGIYTILTSMMMLVDVGMGQTIVREVARYTSKSISFEEIKDTLKTFQYIYFSIGFIALIGIYIFSNVIVIKWLNIENLSFEDAVGAIKLMSFMVFISWLSILYRNAIIGLQHQVWLNVSDVFFAVISKMGVILVLAYISSSIVEFLSYQLIILVIQLIVMYFKLKKVLPQNGYKSKISINVIKRLWKFASGVAVTTLFGTLIAQADKVILSTFLSLKTFGLYTVASVVGKSLGNVISPITLAIRPRLTIIYEQGNEKELIEFYHKSAQLMSIMSFPIGVVLVLFSKDILWIWTGDMELVNEIWLIVSLLVVGTLLNGMMHVPYSLQLSSGWSSLAAKSNIVLFFTTVPILIIGIKEYGMIAAPIVWLFINLMYVLVIISLMHKRLLKTEKLYWYKYDIAYILFSSILIGTTCRYFIPFSEEENKILLFIYIFISYIMIMTGAVLSSTKFKNKIFNIVKRKINA